MHKVSASVSYSKNIWLNNWGAIMEHTVTTFVSSRAGKQLSTKRVLFHAAERLAGYSPESGEVIQRVIPPVSVALCPTSACTRACVFCSNAQRNAANRRVKAEYSDAVFAGLTEDLDALGEGQLVNAPCI